MRETRPWPTHSEAHAHMKMRQNQNRKRGLTKAEQWMLDEYLLQTNLKWTPQAQWGFRLFDFWNSMLGLAVEVDGPEHNASKDIARDAEDWERSRILVLRVRNWNRLDAEDALQRIRLASTWNSRRIKAGLKPVSNTAIGVA